MAHTYCSSDFNSTPFSSCCGTASMGRSCASCGEEITHHVDSPVDIGRFCQAISTGDDGGWASTNYERMTFTVENVDCYPTDLPGAIQHNAWWDAMALRHKLTVPA